MPFSSIDPKVSVIMSVFNDERFLSKAIQSILNQTYKNFEFIIIDDASNDRSPGIIQEYSKEDNRIKYISNEINRGLPKNLNRMIGVAKGSYIARMDADEISTQNRFQEQFDYLESHPDYAVVASWYVIIDDNDDEIAKIQVPTNGEYLVDDFIEKGPRFCHGSVMMRKGALIRAGKYREEFRYVQDLDLWLRMAETNNFFVIPKFLYHRRLSLGMIEKTKIKRFYAACAKESAIRSHKGEEDCVDKLSYSDMYSSEKTYSDREKAAKYHYLTSIYRQMAGKTLQAQMDLLKAIFKYPASIKFWYKFVLNLFPSCFRKRLILVIQRLLEKRILQKLNTL